jgi:hypothetical protein
LKGRSEGADHDHVLVNLKENVAPEEYERWLDERYVPAVLELRSVVEWRGHRVASPRRQASRHTNTS